MLNFNDDVLASHGVLVVVLVVLVEDGGNLLAILTDGQQGLLVVVGGNMELEHVDTSHGGSEDTSVRVETTSMGGVYMFQFHIATHDNRGGCCQFRTGRWSPWPA